MTNICTIWSYDEIKKSEYLGEKQSEYLFVFTSSASPLTHHQASMLVENHFCHAVPERNGRIAELEAMGFIDKVDIVTCEKSGKKVNRWEYTGRRKPLDKIRVKCKCPYCKGTGEVVKEEYIKEERQLTFC